MGKSASSRRWLQRQSKDHYVRQARIQNKRSRALYKLEQIDRAYRLFRPGMTVIDLGAAPGGWSQYAAQSVGRQGSVIAIDIKPMVSLDCVTFIQGDLENDSVIEQLLAIVGEHEADILLSDMAPNATGMISIDQPRAMAFAGRALDLVRSCLRKDGHFLVKLFHGAGFDEFVYGMRALFTQVIVNKPNASRAHSREIYLLGLRKLEGAYRVRRHSK